MRPPLEIGTRVRAPDGLVLVVRAMYLPQRARAASVALRSECGSVDRIEPRASAEAMERA